MDAFGRNGDAGAPPVISSKAVWSHGRKLAMVLARAIGLRMNTKVSYSKRMDASVCSDAVSMMPLASPYLLTFWVTSSASCEACGL